MAESKKLWHSNDTDDLSLVRLGDLVHVTGEMLWRVLAVVPAGTAMQNPLYRDQVMISLHPAGIEEIDVTLIQWMVVARGYEAAPDLKTWRILRR